MKKVIENLPKNLSSNNNNKKYMMHKYWGKKPAQELRELILKYSEEQDILLDPFAGYGGFASEAVLENRNVISNDLNPMSNFINSCLLSTKINFEIMDIFIKTISEETKSNRDYWYKFSDEGNQFEIVTALRKHDGTVTKLKILEEGKKKQTEFTLNEKDANFFNEKEEKFEISEWFPKDKIIPNSRISAKEGMTVSDLFDKRALSCHAKLFQSINKLPDSDEKNLILLAFTSNLANCSKLVPPIKSRGEMSQGAWMTGFYTGETYLENNVFHYFNNRLAKVIAGKKEFLKQYYNNSKNGKYSITNEDSKRLSIKDEYIDFIFTDFPYGDAVPYFEQSIIWNSWMKFDVDYKNEIVISNSKKRKKTNYEFEKDIYQSVSEIFRVLKNNKYFIFTYHSLSGREWTAITNAILKVGFEVIECDLLIQKTFTPRQLNRVKTIKGDLVVVCKKNNSIEIINEFSDPILEEEFIKGIFKDVISSGCYETNEIIVKFLQVFFKQRTITQNTNIISLIEEVANFDGKGWVLKDEDI